MGKITGVLIVGTALLAGIAIYYLQVYGYYEEVATEGMEVSLTSLVTGAPEPILSTGLKAIDADSSPLRYRACFTTTHSHAMLTESFVVYDNPEPLNAPGWFDCFDAELVGETLEQEAAIAYLAQADVHDGVDRVVAIFDDGRGFAWHQLNEKYQD